MTTNQETAAPTKVMIAFEQSELALLDEIADSLQDSIMASNRRRGKKIKQVLSHGVALRTATHPQT
jgi:hypothetical protein